MKTFTASLSTARTSPLARSMPAFTSALSWLGSSITYGIPASWSSSTYRSSISATTKGVPSRVSSSATARPTRPYPQIT